MEKEKEIADRLREELTEEQMILVEKYYAAIYSAVGACELLAYRQGMRDMADILYGNKAVADIQYTLRNIRYYDGISGIFCTNKLIHEAWQSLVVWNGYFYPHK